MTRILLLAFVLHGAARWLGAAEAVAGKGSFEFVDVHGDPKRPVTVWTYLPAGCLPDCPVQFVLHGVNRNGAEYRDQWVPLADAGRFMVAAPEFSREHYPEDADYSQGRVSDERDRDKWAFAVPEHVFDELKRRTGTTATTYRAFGHSAGGQFVHRWAIFRPADRASVRIAANPGFYTMPEWDSGKAVFEFPYSLVGSPIGERDLKAALARPFVLMLGEKDDDPEHRHLNRSRGARAQGAHRLERGRTFFAAAAAAAERLKVPFAWKLALVPGVGHDGGAMAHAAAEYMQP